MTKYTIAYSLCGKIKKIKDTTAGIKHCKCMFDYVSQSIQNKGTSLKHNKRKTLKHNDLKLL